MLYTTPTVLIYTFFPIFASCNERTDNPIL